MPSHFTNTPEHRAWTAMKQRCFNPKNPGFKNYGGRGITVCERWKNSFKDFLADMGSRPSPKHEIDRIDNDGNYEPGNCRWALGVMQHRNKRDNRWITFQGVTMVLLDWANKLGILRQSLEGRLERMSVEEALNPNFVPKNSRMITYDGKTLSLKDWANLLGISRGTLESRLKKWPIEKAFTEPVKRLKR